MSRGNNTITGNTPGVSFPLGNEDAASHEESVQETKGRTDRFEVGAAEAESPVGAGSESGASMQSPVGKTLQERKNALMKNGEEVKIPAPGNASNLRTKTKPAFDAEVAVDEPSTVAVDAKQVSLFGSVLEQLTKEKGVTYSSVVKDVARAAEDAPEAPTQSEFDAIDDTYASIDELTAETTKPNEPAIRKIKHYSRLWVFFQIVKRSLRTFAINTFDGVKAKDFHKVKDDLMEVLKGTQLENLAIRYNALCKELEETDKASVLQRDLLKKKLLEQARLMDKEIDELISCSDYLLHEACGEVSATDRAMLAEKLRSKIGFNLSLPKTMKAAESAASVKDSVEDDADTPLVGSELSQSILPEEVVYDVPPAPRPVSGAGQPSAAAHPSSTERDSDAGHYDVPSSNRPIAESSPEAHGAFEVSDQFPAPSDEVMNDKSFSQMEGEMPEAPSVDGSHDVSDEFPAPPPSLMTDAQHDEFKQESSVTTASTAQSSSRGEKPEVPPRPAAYPRKGESKKE